MSERWATCNAKSPDADKDRKCDVRHGKGKEEPEWHLCDPNHSQPLSIPIIPLPYSSHRCELAKNSIRLRRPHRFRLRTWLSTQTPGQLARFAPRYWRVGILHNVLRRLPHHSSNCINDFWFKFGALYLALSTIFIATFLTGLKTSKVLVKKIRTLLT